MKKPYLLVIVALALSGALVAMYYENLGDFYRFVKAMRKLDSTYTSEAKALRAANEMCIFNAKDLNDENAFIAHGAGGITLDKPYSYTNSKEALLASLKNGYKFIEIDLMLDKDGKIFGAHDYKHFYSITNAPKDVMESALPPSKDYIKNAKIHNQFTPLTLDSINEIFLANPQAFLVTDKLNDFDAIKHQLKFQERILVEVFGLDNYYRARLSGIKYPMLSTGDFRLAQILRIPIIATHSANLKSPKKATQAEEYIKNGGCIMVFSSNEREFMESHIGVRASKFYTDFWDIPKQECTLSDKTLCKTY